MPTITQADIDQISDDFNDLLDDIMQVVPSHDPRVDMAVMAFKMAEASMLTMLKQHMRMPVPPAPPVTP